MTTSQQLAPDVRGLRWKSPTKVWVSDPKALDDLMMALWGHGYNILDVREEDGERYIEHAFMPQIFFCKTCDGRLKSINIHASCPTCKEPTYRPKRASAGGADNYRIVYVFHGIEYPLTASNRPFPTQIGIYRAYDV